MSLKNSFFNELHDASLSGVALKNLQLKKTILNYFANEGNTTLADLSKTLNISIPKTNDLIGELIEENLVKDYGKTEANVGRKPNLYGLEPASAFFVGVEVRKFYVNIGIMDFKKQILKHSFNIPYRLDNTPESLDQLCQIIDEFIISTNIKRSKILGIGINLSGRINYKTGHSYNFFNFKDKPLSTVIEEHIGIHTYLENDSRAMAFGEFCMGAVTDEKDVLFVNIDHGIGMGIMVNGELYYGKSGFAGEFGHIPIFQNEIICHCGKKGCLETEASGEALLRKFKEKLRDGASSILSRNQRSPEDIKLEHIIEAANNDDTLAIELVAEIGEKIGKGMATLVNLFNPELIIIGGLLAQTGDYIRLPIKNALNTYSLSLVNKDSNMLLSTLKEKAGVLGACTLVRNRLLS